MKVSILQENLARGLGIASRSVATRAQLPILNNVLISTDKGRLKISATNLETGVNLWLGAKVEKQGSVAIPAKILTEFVANLPVGKVELETKENRLTLVSGTYRASFVGLPASEFPAIPSLTEKDKGVVFEGEALSQAVSQVAFAAAIDEGRPVLTGVLFVVEEEGLRLIATDGYRLSLKKVDLSKQSKVKELIGGLIVPAKALQEVARVIDNSEDKKITLAVTAEKNQIIINSSDVEVVSRLVEGEFPDYQRIIPEKGSTEIEMDRQELVRAVKMASIFARESANIVKFESKGSLLKISANTAQVGDNLSQVSVKTKGEGGKIAFNSRYLLDFLSVVDSDLISFEMSGSLDPGVFRLKGKSSLLHIIMPVRVQE
ncbi:DNA polymerase III subunit beta [Patescibacteria group bacterium]